MTATGDRGVEVARVLAEVLGDRDARHRAAQRIGEQAASASLSRQQLVYGELDVATVATLLDAADVGAGEGFLDVGSGDGVPVLAAALLVPGLRVARGVEIVAGLAARAAAHRARLAAALEVQPRPCAPIELQLGDIYDPACSRWLADTTFALCFATTWSTQPRRELPELSRALSAMPPGARVVVVDARLVEGAGWRWEGDLRIHPPDTAPHSTARLYLRI